VHVRWVVAVVVVVLLVGAAITAIVLRGHLSGHARAGDLEFQVAGGRKAKPVAGEASITGSKAGRDATATGSSRATIQDSEAGRDLTARAGEPPDPKA
jgi:hypothetical protein